MRPGRIGGLALLVAFALTACGDDGASAGGQGGDYGGMEGPLADCEFQRLTFETSDGARHPVDINGLAVEAVDGGVKVDATTWDVVQRRGVRLSAILERAGLATQGEIPVNCVARDGWDPLRTQLGGDTSLLPSLGFFASHGYVYVCSPGDKDPLYPEMEGRSLCVDYDVAADEEVPEALGGTIESLSKVRWKMVETIDAETLGVFELDPEP